MAVAAPGMYGCGSSRCICMAGAAARMYGCGSSGHAWLWTTGLSELFARYRHTADWYLIADDDRVSAPTSNVRSSFKPISQPAARITNQLCRHVVNLTMQHM